MDLIISHRQNFTLVNKVDAESLKYLGLNKMPNAHLGHDWDGHRLLNLDDELRVTHAGDPTIAAYIRRNTLQRHDRTGACSLGYSGLLGIDYVHNYAALEHFG